MSHPLNLAVYMQDIFQHDVQIKIDEEDISEISLRTQISMKIFLPF